MISLSPGCCSATCATFGRKLAASSATGMPARSAAGHTQSMVPSVGHVFWCGCKNVKRRPSMPGGCVQPSISARLSGLSSGKFPRIASRSGCWRAASMASSLAFGSHDVGGWITAASTPAASISFNRSSLVKLTTCRWFGLAGLPPLQMWTCASTMRMACSLARGPGLVDDRLEHERAQDRDVMPPQRRLHHRDDDHLLLGIGPPVGGEGARPEVVARRARHRGEAVRLAHRDPQTPRVTRAGKAVGAARDLAQVVRRDELDGLRAEHADAREAVAVGEHLAEAGVVAGRGPRAAAAAVDLPRHGGIMQLVLRAGIGM